MTDYTAKAREVREAMEQVARDEHFSVYPKQTDVIAAALREAVEAEREAITRWCRAGGEQAGNENAWQTSAAWRMIAEAIEKKQDAGWREVQARVARGEVAK